MLEGDIESLEMHLEPTLYPYEIISVDETTNLDQIISREYSCSGNSGENIINPLLRNIS